MFNIVVFGPPGSGKGTQSKKIAQEYNLTHISTGEILRAEIKSGSQLGVIAAAYINKGELVPNETIIGILKNNINSTNSTRGVIFDGFPRTVEQAEALKKMLAGRGQKINLMFNLKVHKEELIDRLMKRGKISGRADDNYNTIEKRIQIYECKTAPVIDFYIKEKCYKEIRGTGSIDDIFNLIKEEVDSCIKEKNKG